ncbi:MAG: anti-sigma factor domain-containing protein [Clostridium sp.]|nr:anti-sigma factor domain-containing protein [Clostridium sp.]
MEDFKKDRYIFSNKPGFIDVGQKSKKAREQQITNFNKELFEYEVLLKDLAIDKPNQKEKNLILNIAYYVAMDYDIVFYFKEKKALNIGLISKKTRISKKFLERWKDYLITYILIMESTNYKYIQDYLRVLINEDVDEEISNDLINKKEHRGIVMECGRKSCIILTSSGEFFNVFNKEGFELGDEIMSGKERKLGKRIKTTFSAILLITIFISIYMYNQYNKVISTIIIEVPYSIKFEINKYNSVIYSYSPSNIGTKILKEINPLDKNIDFVLKESIKKAKEHEIISTEGVVITVNGKALDYGILENTGDYIVENNVKTLINNNGNKHYLYESMLNKKEENTESKTAK